MVEKEKLNKLIWRLLRGFQEGFSDCRTIREGLSYKRIIPKSFWDNPEYGYLEIFGRFNLKKWELREIHKEVIERIIHEINHPLRKRNVRRQLCSAFPRTFYLGSSKKRYPCTCNRKKLHVQHCLFPLGFGRWY